MNRNLLAISAVAIMMPLAGCIGSDWTDFEPGTDYSPTGKTVHIRMWVEDMVKSDIFPGMQANLWAFCAEPANPDDEYSANAIEHREPQGVVERLQPEPDADGNPVFILDEDATSKCSVPGPQLRVKQGDKVIVDFTNNHFHPHTIHWHGQFVPWEADGVPGSTQDAVVPPTAGGVGEFRYEFEAKRAGTLWYHCHVDTQFHVMQGLYGVIIVEPQDKTYEPVVDRDYTLVFSNLIRSNVEPDPTQTDPHVFHKHGLTCGVTGAPKCKNPALTDEPDVFLINGVSAPNTFMRNDTLMKINPGETIRIRMLNAGPFTIETIHLHGHDMLVTHIDGNPLNPEARYWVDTILIGPGQRYDVVVKGEEGREGIWVMHTHITSRVTNSHQYPGGMLTKLVYEDWMEENNIDITPYDLVEAVGGVPYIKPYSIPDDAFFEQRYGGTQIADATLAVMEFPVEMPCATKRIIVKVDTDGIVGFNPSSVSVTLEDDRGNLFREGNLDANGELQFVVLDEYVEAGSGGMAIKQLADVDGQRNMTITVSGSNINAEFEIDAMVDYYRTKEAAQWEANKVVQRPMCEELMNPGLTGFYAPTFPPEE